MWVCVCLVVGVRLGCRSYQKLFVLIVNQPHLVVRTVFSVLIYVYNLFHVFYMPARQWKFKIKVFLPGDCLSSCAVALHLPRAAGYMTAVIHLRPFSGIELDLVLRGYFRRMPRDHFMDSEDLPTLSPSAMTNLRTYIIYVYKYIHYAFYKLKK